MVKKMTAQSVVTLFFIVCGSICAVVDAATIQDQCSSDIPKVTACLQYATGKTATPSKECCKAATDIKDRDPVCLCYIIQLTHNGNAQIKTLGIQEARLLQLSSACQLTNASISDCPKLLNLTASSPDYAIFTNSSSTIPANSTGTSSPSTANGSNVFNRRPSIAEGMAIAMAIFFAVIPAGFASVICT
ncbi:hypothetical protein F0562_033544 [Nyssa sinensis]|uniref:Bifunctional inhibitor/plant lipid transfer protein/seed storage helical domain-containing protein n=1 Tax=Nyssa sinensis TaxID=561372 RepID=A0A5J5AFK2_9ASTE|nr:hypothetical protein F0562_033544 [Nyssa sinensis]